jgi:glutamyl-tRNA(Gln) amidotransferase subunit E
MSPAELSNLVAKTIEEGMESVRAKGTSSFSSLMGKVMAKARGKADGAKVSAELKRQLEEIVSKTAK